MCPQEKASRVVLYRGILMLPNGEIEERKFKKEPPKTVRWQDQEGRMWKLTKWKRWVRGGIVTVQYRNPEEVTKS